MDRILHLRLARSGYVVGMVSASTSTAVHNELSWHQEHVSRRRTLLPAPIPHERLDIEPLPGSRDLGIYSHQPGINDCFDKDAKECLIHQKNIYFAGHQHLYICGVVAINIGQMHTWRLLRFLAGGHPDYQFCHRLDTEWTVRICVWLWKK